MARPSTRYAGIPYLIASAEAGRARRIAARTLTRAARYASTSAGFGVGIRKRLARPDVADTDCPCSRREQSFEQVLSRRAVLTLEFSRPTCS